MKKLLFFLAVMLAAPALTMKGQTYSSLWKQVEKATNDDLPQTEQKLLRQIAAKAEQEKAYGQLLKAELQEVRALTDVSGDSLKPAIARLQAREQAAQEEPLRAVYNTVLGYIYRHSRVLDETEDKRLYEAFYDKALAHPEMLAAVKATDYEPLIKHGTDSKLFDDDLLSVIGYETERYDVLRAYYLKTGNRRAALLTSLEVLKRERPSGREVLNKSVYIHRLDSLINEYADLAEAGEVAIERYDFMNEQTAATPEQLWQYINLALDRWGAWQGMNTLRNSQRELTALNFSAMLEHEVNIPDRQQNIKLTALRGIDQLTMRVYSVKMDADSKLRPENSDDYKKMKQLLTALPHLTQVRTYIGKQPYETYEDSLTMEGLPVGIYMVEFESQPSTQVSRHLYYVSNLRVLHQDLSKTQVRYVVVDATTGQPVKGAKIRLSWGWYKNRKTVTVTTDDKGEYLYTYEEDHPYEIYVTTDKDRSCPGRGGYGNYSYYGTKSTQERTAIYTDRSIYRPGQKVSFAAIAYTTDNGYEHQVMAGRKVTAYARNANHDIVYEQQLVTDEYGTCAGEFTLPRSGLNGSYSISIAGSTRYFKVEEYKRPTFEVTFPTVNQRYEDGDTVVVKATARSYAGVPVQGAKVKYTVERRLAFWWFTYSRYWGVGAFGTGSDDELVSSGEAVTDADGCFKVEIPMTLPKTLHPMFYNFVVHADVTDQAGETHAGEMSLPLGNRKTAFSVDMPEKMLAEKPTDITFHLRNAAGMDISANLRYRIDNGKWQNMQTNTPLALSANLASGKHNIEAICEDDTLRRDFTVFSLDDKRPATKTDDWFYVSDSQFPIDGTPVTIQVGSSDKNVHIVYTLLANGNVIESSATDRSNELINRKLTYREEYGDGLLLTFAWVKNGKTYTHQTTIRRPLPNKNLTLRWETFRDRLTPGQEEQWTLTVTDPDNKPARAQLMAVLYDKSLDQLTKNNWSLSPDIWLQIPAASWNFTDWGTLAFNGFKQQSWLTVRPLALSHFDHDIYPDDYGRRQRIGNIRYTRAAGGRALAKNSMAVQEDMMLMKSEVAEEVFNEAPIAVMGAKSIATSDAEADEAAEEAAEEQQQTPQIRENLNETAFFYPQLTTDEQGLVSLKFRLPESLTTWRFMGIAHTADMMHGMLSGETVAKKDVMIQPNIPRFVRHGDHATISARIFNTGTKAISGTARLQLIDPETEAVILDKKQQVSLGVDSTASVTFDVDASTIEQTLLIAKMSVSGRNFSDGEQHYLPVLPNSERVTVTVPFTQIEPGTKTIDLAKLFPANQLSPGTSRLTVEYTNNPAWLMLQALPTVGKPCDENAISQAASLYANSIGRYILEQNPTAKGVFEMWSREEGQETSLMSNLQKDQELKDLLLNETPWVMDANREQEQKQRLADFFDENLMSQRLASALDKLRQLQLGNGAWTWWKGMNGSTYITITISEMLVRLNLMTGQQKETEKMLSSAFKFMGSEMIDLVDRMKQQEKKGFKPSFPSFTALQWLYICALDGRELPKKVVEANTYLKNLLKKETKNQTIYEKAMSAIILNSKTYIKSLKEYTVYKEDMGRYYDTHRASYSWRNYRIPTQVAAIEAIQRLTPEDKQTITEMQRWLLQQKRTQSWDTPINSVDAIYAFLREEGTVKSNKFAPAPHTVLKVDGQELSTSDATAGIGYVKTAMSGKDVKTFTAEKTSTGTSWGAVYAQFMQHTADIADHQSGISVKREILISDNQTSNLKPQTSNLKPGDRITIRITIEADRDYDFVQVVDKRAACMEPVHQLSGYHWGMYCSPKDYTTNYYFDMLSKGKHVIESEYYIDRAGTYETGTCTVECAYSPEFRATTKSTTIHVE